MSDEYPHTCAEFEFNQGDKPMPPKPIDLQMHRDTIALATPGPWEAALYNGEISGSYGRVLAVGKARIAATESNTDAMFIAEAREGWPAAVAEVERLRAQVKRMKNSLEAILGGAP